MTNFNYNIIAIIIYHFQIIYIFAISLFYFFINNNESEISLSLSVLAYDRVLPRLSAVCLHFSLPTSGAELSCFPARTEAAKGFEVRITLLDNWTEAIWLRIVCKIGEYRIATKCDTKLNRYRKFSFWCRVSRCDTAYFTRWLSLFSPMLDLR